LSAEYVQILTTVGSEEPEILAIPVLAGSAGYLSWISENVG